MGGMKEIVDTVREQRRGNRSSLWTGGITGEERQRRELRTKLAWAVGSTFGEKYREGTCIHDWADKVALKLLQWWKEYREA